MTKREFLKLLLDTAEAGKFPAQSPEDRVCVYRSSSGRRCPVGLLIPDENYYPGLEGKTAAHDDVQAVATAPEGMTWDDLNHVQALHDRCSPWEDGVFEDELKAMDCFSDVQ